LVACVLAGFAAATRNVGVFLVVPLMYEWIKGIESFRWRGIYLFLAPGGLFAYMGYLWVRFGDPFLFYSAQESWGRQATGPLDTASRAWGTAVEGSGRLLDSDLWAHPSLSNAANQLAGASNFFNLVFFVFATIVLLAGLRYLPLSLSVYGLLLVAPATLFGTPGSPLMGTPRYVLVAFPVFIVLALLFKNRVLLGGWLVISTLVSLVLCGLFVSWRFVA
jgi:hypothetical protein